MLLKLVLAVLCGLAIFQASNGSQPAVIPPIQWTDTPNESTGVQLTEATEIIFGDQNVKALGEMLVKEIHDLKGFELILKEKKSKSGDVSPVAVSSITLTIDSSITSDEGYTLTIGKDIVIKAKTTSGLAFGTRTLLQMMKNGDSLPQGSTTDQPEHGLRFFSLDCARHFYSMDFLRDLIRRLSWYKMNGLIMHCVDAEAFRFDLEEFPDLAPKGYSYSKADITELIELGETLGVDIISGWEFPGHNTKINLYFGTSLGEDCAKQFYEWVTPDWLMDLTNPKSMEISQKILSAAMPWFKSKYIHLGADELPPAIGECEKIKKYMVEKNIKSWGDMAIEWTNQLVDWVKSQGKQAIIFNGLEHMDYQDKVVTKDAIVQFWTQPGLEYWQEHGHRLIMSEPADKIFYLTPNAYHYIFPDHQYAYETWIPKEGVKSRSSSPSLSFDDNAVNVENGAPIEDKSITLGYAMNVWGDYINHLEDAYVEKYATYPTAIVGTKSWNIKTRDMIGKLETDFRAVYDLVGLPPSLIGQPESIRDGFREIHHYSFEEEPLNPSIIAACSAPNCLFVEDKQGKLHGSTYISTSTGNFFGEGKYGKGLEWDRVWGKEGLGLAAVDISPPWTYSAWIRMKESEEGAPLMFSRDASLKLEQRETKRIGVSVYGDEVSHHSFDEDVKFPMDEQFHHLAITNDGEMTRVYIDGEIKGNPLPVVFNLPMISVGGYDPPRGDGIKHQAPMMVLDEMRIFEGAADSTEVKWIRDMLPDVNPNKDRDDEGDSAAYDRFDSAFLLLTILTIILTIAV